VGVVGLVASALIVLGATSVFGQIGSTGYISSITVGGTLLFTTLMIYLIGIAVANCKSEGNSVQADHSNSSRSTPVVSDGKDGKIAQLSKVDDDIESVHSNSESTLVVSDEEEEDERER
jgi:hypothetical protein